MYSADKTNSAIFKQIAHYCRSFERKDFEFVIIDDYTWTTKTNYDEYWLYPSDMNLEVLYNIRITLDEI